MDNLKIVVTNECFLKDEHVARLKKLGAVSIFNDTDSELKTIERLKDADIAIVDCFIATLNKNVFEKSSLKYLTLNSIGYDPVDLEAAKAKNILVSNIPGFSAEAVAEHAMALMFASVRRIAPMDKKTRANPYEIDPGDVSQRPFLGFNLRDKTIGIIGTGSIGGRMAFMTHALGMTVMAYSRTQRSIMNVNYLPLEELLRKSDVVSLHTPLNKESENLIGEKELQLMKKHAVLINTARGKVVNTEALYKALSKGIIGGAGLDVIADAPKGHPIYALGNVVFTPHAAWYTQESFENLANMVVENVEAYIKEKPINLI